VAALDGERLYAVFEVFVVVAGHARSLCDEILGEELAEALGIAGFVRADLVEVEVLENRQIFIVLRVVVHVLLLPAYVEAVATWTARGSDRQRSTRC
jgi:hypothetical protein